MPSHLSDDGEYIIHISYKGPKVYMTIIHEPTNTVVKGEDSATLRLKRKLFKQIKNEVIYGR